MKNTNKDYSDLGMLAAKARELKNIEIAAANSEIEALVISATPLNQFITKIYNLEGKELNTYKQWLLKGFQVKKGEKGYLFSQHQKYSRKRRKRIIMEVMKTENTSVLLNAFCSQKIKWKHC